jgi:hypothetical protein
MYMIIYDVYILIDVLICNLTIRVDILLTLKMNILNDFNNDETISLRFYNYYVFISALSHFIFAAFNLIK